MYYYDIYIVAYRLTKIGETMAKSRKATFDEVAQCNQYFIDNYAHKIARKWGAKQGIKIKKYDDLCDEGKKEKGTTSIRNNDDSGTFSRM